MKPHLFIAIPAMDELDFLPKTLDAIANQKTEYPFTVYVCVNQPDSWWDDPEKKDICLKNQQLISYISSCTSFKIVVQDHASKSKGWVGKNHGVGWARKCLFDEILSIAEPEDIIISLDADTLFNENYFQSIGENFDRSNCYPVLSVPYYHPLTDDEATNKAMLRYELYMRFWFLNMHRIASPYTFTAIGSGIAMKVHALRKIGGITPVKSGEDFYLMQKFRKMTSLNQWNSEAVYPAGRLSDRVFFGTGPALIKGMQGNWNSYPIYHFSFFDPIAESYQSIEQLFHKDISTPFLQFLQEQFKDNNLWQPLRKNFKELPRFKRAFHEKADGLRILQFIKQEYDKHPLSDEVGLYENLKLFLPEKSFSFLNTSFTIDELTVDQLQEVRNALYQEEMEKRLLLSQLP